MPEAVPGDAELIGTIRCGNSKLPGDRVAGQLLLADEAAAIGVEAAAAVVEAKHALAVNSTFVHWPRGVLSMV